MKNTLDPRHRLYEKLWNSFIGYRRKHDYVQHWTNQKENDTHSFDKYIEMDESCKILVDEVQDRSENKGDKILDLGCNVGRMLNNLHTRGFYELYGVDVGKTAIAAMPEVFPEMAKSAQVDCCSFEEYFPRVSDKFFDLTYTHGATVELVHPSFIICNELARVTKKYCILGICEGDHTYPRLWTYEFLRNGFLLVKLLRPITEGSPISLMVFKRLSI